jgi:cell division septal protein FtsQ
VEVICHKPEIENHAAQFLTGKRLGNILLLDIEHLRKAMEAHRWVKEVHVRKVFPAALKIEIKERTPAAALKKESLVLIDREGIHLEKIESMTEQNVPLFVDAHNFRVNMGEKLNLAWECMDALNPALRDQIEVLDLSEFGNLQARLKRIPTWLKLGNNHFAERIQIFQSEWANLEKFGNLDYIDLRIQGRLYFKPRKRLIADEKISLEKEGL